MTFVPVWKGRETGGAAEKRRRRERRESHGRREAEWFYKVLGGRVPDEGAVPPEVRSAAVQIDAWLKRRVSAFHRGALSLRYRPRNAAARRSLREFGDFSSLAVRLECALHPAMGKTNAELEKASVERIEKAIEARNAQIEKATAAEKAGSNARCPSVLGARISHSPAGSTSRSSTSAPTRLFALAIRALGKVRGDAPCALPRSSRVRTRTRRRSCGAATEFVGPPRSVRHRGRRTRRSNACHRTQAPSPASGSEAEDEDAPSSPEGAHMAIASEDRGRRARALAIHMLRPTPIVDTELDWFFNRAECDMGVSSNFHDVLHPRLPRNERVTPEDAAEASHAHRTIRRWLLGIPDADAGVLQAAYEQRDWPAWLVDELGRITGVVVAHRMRARRSGPADQADNARARDRARALARLPLLEGAVVAASRRCSDCGARGRSASREPIMPTPSSAATGYLSCRGPHEAGLCATPWRQFASPRPYDDGRARHANIVIEPPASSGEAPRAAGRGDAHPQGRRFRYIPSPSSK